MFSVFCIFIIVKMLCILHTEDIFNICIFVDVEMMKAVQNNKNQHNKIMYYQSKSERYYKVENKKSVRVSRKEAEDNIYQLNKLTFSELKDFLPKKTEGDKEQLLTKLTEMIKKDDGLKKKVQNYLKKKNEKSETTKKPSVGDIVRIIIKPYENGVTRMGVVKDVLTKKEVHTRGHKVRLHNNEVGRLLKIIKKKV